MRRLLAAAAAGVLGALGPLAVPTAALAAPSEGMVLECDSGLTITRANGASWWGLHEHGAPDGSVYVTTHLLITDLDGMRQYEKSYGDTGSRHDAVCVAQHGPFPDGHPGSIWTVTLARSR